MSEVNKTIVERLTEQWNKGKEAALAAVDELLSTDYVLHDPTVGEVKGIEGMRQFVEMVFNGLSDYRETIDDLVTEGSKVVCRWTVQGTHSGEFIGVAPTGKQVTVKGITIYGLADGKFVEAWQTWDALGMLQQLGAIPPLGQAKGMAAAGQS
jgi:steroid delta-isomerase-like uncharacterized protein